MSEEPRSEAGADRNEASPPLLDPLASPERRRARVEELRQLVARNDYWVAADLVAAALIAEHPHFFEPDGR